MKKIGCRDISVGVYASVEYLDEYTVSNVPLDILQ